MDHDDKCIGVKELLLAFGSFQAGDLLSYDGRHTLPTLINGLASANARLKSFTLGPASDFFMHRQQVCSLEHLISST